MSKKHGRFEDNEDEVFDEARKGVKRVKLDQLFDGLSISDNEIKQDHLFINPQINQIPFSDNKNEDINFYIGEKLYQKYQESLSAKISVIKWYDYKLLLVKKFQTWCIRMFNSFLKKYNLKNHLKIPKVRSYDKLLRLIEGKLTIRQLFDIIMQENSLSMINLQKKYINKRNKLENDNLTLLYTLRYNYWDNIKLDKDWEMDDAQEEEQDREKEGDDGTSPKIVEASDSEMEVE